MTATTVMVLTDPAVAAQAAIVRGLLILTGAHLAGTAAVDHWQTRRAHRARRPRTTRHATP